MYQLMFVTNLPTPSAGALAEIIDAGLEASWPAIHGLLGGPVSTPLIQVSSPAGFEIVPIVEETTRAVTTVARHAPKRHRVRNVVLATAVIAGSIYAYRLYEENKNQSPEQ